MSNSLPDEVRNNLPIWKQAYGEVFFIPSVGGDGVVLRNYTLGEHEIFELEAEIDDSLATENLIVKCLVWPPKLDLDELPQPTIGLLLQKLNEVSPYDNPVRFFEKLEKKRSMVNTPIGAMYTYIAAAFPSMKLRDIQALHCDEVLTYLAMSEKILGKQLELNTTGQVQAVPEEGMTPAQLAQLHKKAKFMERREARRKRMEEQAPPEETPVTEEVTGPPRMSLLADRDALMNALRGTEM